MLNEKERLKKEFAEWTEKYVEAYEHYKSLQSEIYSKRKNDPPFILNEKSYPEYMKAEKEVEIAEVKRREILERIFKLRNEE